MSLHLTLKAGVTSGIIHVVADIVAQAVETRGQSLTNPAEAHNAERTKRFALVGLTLHGPFFQRGFALVDKRFGAPTSMRVVSGPGRRRPCSRPHASFVASPSAIWMRPGPPQG